MSAVSPSPLLLTCLERFERQSHKIEIRDDVVVSFCQEIIPFLSEISSIATLRDSWQSHCAFLNYQAQETDAQALLETKEIFLEIKKSIDSPNEAIQEKLSFIEKLLSGQKGRHGSPLYRTVYNQLKKLCELLLKHGYHDLCKRYAKLVFYKTHIQKDPNQTIRWARRLENGSLYYLSAKEVQEAHEDGEENLILFTPDYELIDKIDIEEVTFAPTVIKAYSQIDEIHWKRSKDPAITWWYFEYALWCWKTPESYFDQIMTSEEVENYGKYFYTLSNKVVWREIACVRDNKALERIPDVFTKEFFQKGLTTLINSINIFLSNETKTYSPSFFKPKQAMIIFELILDGNELWIKATFENQKTERFYIQKFYESSDPEGSPLYKFVKSILKSPEPGKKKAKLLYKWETSSRHINRLNLPNVLKEAFFGKTHGSIFNFKGLAVELPDDSIDVLRQLRERHLKRPTNLRNRG